MSGPLQGAGIYAIALGVNWMIAAAALRSREMTARIEPASWIFAVAGALGAALAASPSVLETAATAVLASTVVTCAATDISSGYVFDVTTLSASALMLALAGLDGRLVAALLGAACGGGTLLTLHVLTRGRGMGLGDAKLAAAAGVGLGGAAALAAIGIAFVTGALLVLVALAARRVRFGEAIPFAPYLAFGTLVYMVLPVAHG